MTEFQREVVFLAVTLAFLYGCSGYVETVLTATAAILLVTVERS